MSTPGRPKGECRNAQHEGTPVSTPPHFALRLYVAGEAPHSTRALANLRALCLEHLPGRHQIEVIDVLHDPQRALSDGVFLTPLLVKLAPEPARRIAGNLNDLPPVLAALGLLGG
jgi:circadian clock protein KaiB